MLLEKILITAIRSGKFLFLALTVLVALAAIYLLRDGDESTPRPVTGHGTPKSPAVQSEPLSGAVYSRPITPDLAKASGTSGGATVSGAFLGYDRSGDLYSFATNAVGSNDRRVVLDAWWATMACQLVGPSREELESISAGLGRQGAPVSQPQRGAAKMILERCRGFFDNEGAASSGLRSSLRARMGALGDTYVRGLSRGIPTPAQLNDIVVLRDWQTFIGSQDLLQATAKNLGIESPGKDMDLLGLAWFSATCDIGQDCTSNGLVRATHCVRTGDCDYGNAASFKRSELSADDLAKFDQYRSWIVSNFLAGNAAAFRN
jgi:hypothetical protein